MIRINLLPHKKKHRAAPVEGEQTVGIGFGILLGFAALIFFVVHGPMQSDIDDQGARNSQLVAENKKIEKRIADFDSLKAAFEAAQKQAAAIDELNGARATPANFLFELATILRSGGQPTVTAAMAKQLDQNENLRWQQDWDPKHVWIDKITEKGGEFTLVGSAQSDGDVTQLAHRLSASTYFQNVQPEGSSKGSTKGGITVYEFKITGTVRY
jgi:Tfp pilus assembly protein PilN